MSQETTQDLPVGRLQDLIVRSSTYAPERLLDTLSETENGDTILSDKAIESYDAEAVDQLIEQWSSYIVSLEPTTIEAQARIAVAHKHINELNLVRALFAQRLGDTDRSDEIRDFESKLYDHYDPQLYGAALKQKIAILEKLNVTDPELQQAKAVLLDDLESFQNSLGGETAETLEQPDPETLKAVAGWLNQEFGEALAEIEQYEGPTLSADEIKVVFDHAIETNVPLETAGWRVRVIDREKNSVSTYPSTKEIHISSKKVASKAEVAKLLIHEVFGHALRSANAEQMGNEVGSKGTGGYSPFEESFEMAMEQCFEQRYDPERGLNHYIAIGLATSSNQSPEKIAQLIASIKQIESSVDGLSPDKVAKADNLTAAQLKRTFAGMTDVDSGIAHLKDINYLHGLDGSWRILNHLTRAGQVAEGMSWLLAAKFNPYDKQDRELVNAYAPMPSSLEGFFDD